MALYTSDGTCLGLISVQSYHRNAFDPRHAALLGSIARQVGLVVENARLIEQDQRRLRELEAAYHELELAQHRVVEAERRRAIGDIAAGVAHDFNNLLGAILGNAQLIGLGLAVSQGIIQRHGGELEIHSVEGAGTTVTLQLPTADASAPVGREAAPAPRHTVGSTIVLVEDDATLRSVTQRMLEHAGHHVSAFAGGADAIAHLRQHTTQLVITDLELPGMSGWDVVVAAQAVQNAVRVVLVTGWGDRIAPEDAQRTSVAAVLSKPLEQHALLEAVGRAMHRAA